MSPNGAPSTPARASAREAEFAELASRFLEVWNRECEGVPRLRIPPHGRDAQRLILRVWEVCPDETALAKAVAAFAADPHMRESSFGWETFCRHVERWEGAGQVRRRVVNAHDERIKAMLEGRG